MTIPDSMAFVTGAELDRIISDETSSRTASIASSTCRTRTLAAVISAKGLGSDRREFHILQRVEGDDTE